ncbi:MAG: extracellular solute-binding protein [Chloroflexi bacterium]|nr:extracellular solute-binding protein [Chloroflexota bacterium]
MAAQIRDRFTRRTSLLSLTAAAAAALAACGGEQGAAGQPSGQTAEGPALARAKAPVTVNYLSVSSSADRNERERELFASFNAAQNAVKVEVSAGPGSWVTLREKFIVSHAGGDPMHLVELGWGGGWSDLVDSGAIVELTPYLKRDKLDPKHFLAEAIGQYTLAGKTWALPTSLSVDGWAYNKNLLDKHGLPHPPVTTEDKSWTMEKLLEYAKIVNKPENQIWGFSGAFTGDNSAAYTEGTYFGQGAWDDKAQQPAYLSEGWLRGSQYWRDLEFKHRLVPTADEAKAAGVSRGTGLFRAGKAALSGWYSSLKLDFDWGLATVPYSGPGKNVSGRFFAHALLMGKKDQEAVWQLFKWLTVPENGGRWVLAANHATSPIVKGGSDIAQKAVREQTGVDHRAYLLSAQTMKHAGWGLEKYAWFRDANDELSPVRAELFANKLAVRDFAQRATEVITRHRQAFEQKSKQR